MICCAIANYNVMFGVDFHDGYPFDIISPEGVPFVPHLVAAPVRWLIWKEAAESEHPSVVMPHGNAMSKIFDIGPRIPHLTFPAWNGWLHMLIYTLMSSSQGHFGVASVTIEGEPLAVALEYDENRQLECGDPLPLPTSILFAPNTVVAGLTMGDLMAGNDSMFIHSLIDAAASKLCGNAFDKMIHHGLIDSIVGHYLGYVADSKISKLIVDPFEKNVVDKVTEWEGKLVDRHTVTDEYFNNLELRPHYPLLPMGFMPDAANY